MDLSTDFIYNMGNYYLYKVEGSIVFPVVLILVSVVLTIVLYNGFTCILGYMIMRKEAKLLEHKKSVLQELIVMKDIQTEIEKEIERAMLNETFNG